MRLGRIVGTVVAPHKDDGLGGRKLLVVQPLDGRLLDAGAPIVAVDAIGAGAGEVVLWVRGREAAHAFLPGHVPTDAGVVGIVDAVTFEAGP